MEPEIYVIAACDKNDNIIGYLGTKLPCNIDDPWRHYTLTHMTLYKKSNGAKTLTFTKKWIKENFQNLNDKSVLEDYILSPIFSDLHKFNISHFRYFKEINWQFGWWNMIAVHPQKIFDLDF